MNKLHKFTRGASFDSDYMTYKEKIAVFGMPIATLLEYDNNKGRSISYNIVNIDTNNKIVTIERSEIKNNGT